MSSCIFLRAADYQVESSRKLLSNKKANDLENNVGVEFPQQLLYIPMYGFYTGLSLAFLPFSKETYKNNLETIVMDFNSGVNLSPAEKANITYTK